MENYKEKYEQSLAKAKAIHNLASETSHENTRMAIEELFPELKESEDERIRRELIKVFEERVQHGFEWKDGIPNNAVIAWLEKQGEQKFLWSDEDEKHYQGCLNLMKLLLDTTPYPYYNDYLWLKSLKERMKGE